MYSLIKTENIKTLQNKVLELEKIVSSQEKIIESLKDKLNINSSNSGLPTSKEIYKKEKEKRQKSNKKAGGQKGHKFSGYQFKNPDKKLSITVKEEKCKCGSDLSLEGYSKHQKIDIPPIKPIITEYLLEKKCCTKCSRKYKAKLPDYKLLSPRVESIISSLSGFYNISKRDIQSMLKHMFNLDISLGLISESESRVSSKLKPAYDKLHDEIEEQNFIHVDETSHNNQGKRFWCWLMASTNLTLIKIANSRGKKVISNLLPDYAGNIISDRYAVYNHFDESKRQVCLAHLYRDFKRFAHSSNSHVSEVGYKLLETMDRSFALYHGYKSGKIDILYMRRKIKKVKHKIYYFLRDIKYSSESESAMRVANNILKSFDMMWLFVDNEDIPPTNNFAERQIKHHVKYRKNSYHTWSDRGDRFLERIKSIYATSKLRQQNPFDALLKLAYS